MAACQWAGGKCKSTQQAKAFMRHNSKERRMETQHSNPHIDKSKTHLNFSVKGLTYEERCAAFDQRLSEIDLGRASSGKNARVVMQSVIVYPPAGLVDDKPRLKQWFLRAGELAEARFGANMIDMAVDYDEVHEYIEPKTQERKMSREHGHLWLVPEVDGKLNGKAFVSRQAMRDFNNELHAMSLKEYGVPMMDGSGRQGGKTVEQCKAESEAAAIVAAAEAEAQNILVSARLEAQRVRADAERVKALEAENAELRVQLARMQRDQEQKQEQTAVKSRRRPATAPRKQLGHPPQAPAQKPVGGSQRPPEAAPELPPKPARSVQIPAARAGARDMRDLDAAASEITYGSHDNELAF